MTISNHSSTTGRLADRRDMSATRSATTPPGHRKPLTDHDVTRLEHQRVIARREVAFLGKTTADAANEGGEGDSGVLERPKDLVGVALSGGGIRSATFNDGFITALSHCGLLRYVDYLSVVSGGGYIAGNFLARGHRFEEAASESNGVVTSPSFHDADAQDDQTAQIDSPVLRPADLDIDPDTQQVSLNRMRTVGNYLQGRSQLYVTIFIEFVFRLMLYVGVVGFVATLIALLWRSFDYEEFRLLYFRFLEFRQLNELGIALLPSVCLTVLWLAVMAILAAFRLLGRSGTRLQARIRRWREVGFMGIPTLFLISAAVFLGNGYTRSSATSEMLHLNNIATIVAILAALSQVLVFFGRDKLIRSDRQNAQQWHRVAQSTVFAFTVGTVVFFAVHMMARENISGFLENRNHELIAREVVDWQQLFQISEEFENSQPGVSPTRTLRANAQTQVRELDELIHGFKHKDRWEQYQQESRWFPQMGIAQTPQTGKVVDHGRLLRFIAIPQAWVLANLPSPTVVSPSDGQATTPSSTPSLSAFDTQAAQAGSDKMVSMGVLLAKFRKTEHVQMDFLKVFNQQLRQVSLSKFLAERFKQATADRNLGSTDELLKGWTRKRRFKFLQRVNGLVKENQPVIRSLSPAGEEDQVADFNLDCLQLTYPNLLKPRDVISTPVVINDDQKTRVWYLGFFLLTGGFGLAASSLRFNSSGYRFYRNAIAEHFLTLPSAKKGDTKNFGNLALHEFDLTHAGMPIPLITAAELTADKATSEMVAHPFIFSPFFVGSSTHGYCRTHEYSPGNQIGSGESIQLADALCVSGAALTHKMSNNKATRLMMDFFGLNLGRRLRDPARVHQSVDQENAKRYWWGYSSRLMQLMRTCRHHWSNPGRPAPGTDSSEYRLIADGGFADFLGVKELLNRRCRLIVVSDAGVNSDEHELQALAKMLETAQRETGVRFLDLDHDRPIDFKRLDRVAKKNTVQDKENDSVAPQHYVCMRIDYPHCEEGLQDAFLVYAQMAISDDDPLEIRQIRQKFPHFPDDPTSNQFFTVDQVAAYRRLGYHIGSIICSELARWDADEIAASFEHLQELGESAATHTTAFNGESITQNEIVEDQFLGEEKGASAPDTKQLNTFLNEDKAQPLFGIVLSRLLQAYRMSCFRETIHDDDDVFAEAIWQAKQNQFPHFRRGVRTLSDFARTQLDLLKRRPSPVSANEIDRLVESTIDRWMTVWERNADIRNAYRNAVFQDVNMLDNTSESDVKRIYEDLRDLLLKELVTDHTLNTIFQKEDDVAKALLERVVLALHLAGICMACQQFHTGWLGKIFQVGGRKKLIGLLNQISRDSLELADNWAAKSAVEGSIASCCQDSIGETCPGLLEMQSCVFRSGGQNVVVSFALCLTITLRSILVPHTVAQLEWKYVADFIENFNQALEAKKRKDLEETIVTFTKTLFESRATEPAPTGKNKKKANAKKKAAK